MELSAMMLSSPYSQPATPSATAKTRIRIPVKPSSRLKRRCIHQKSRPMSPSVMPMEPLKSFSIAPPISEENAGSPVKRTLSP